MFCQSVSLISQRLSLVLLLPDPHLRGNASWQGISLLFSLLYHWQDVIIHRTTRLQRHHRCYPGRQPFDTILLSVCAERCKLRWTRMGLELEEEQEGARNLLTERRNGSGQESERGVCWGSFEEVWRGIVTVLTLVHNGWVWNINALESSAASWWPFEGVPITLLLCLDRLIHWRPLPYTKKW